MVDKILVRRKLNKMIKYIGQLEEVNKYTLEDYLDNFFIKRTTERLVQLVVEVATDINAHIVVDEGYSPPDDYYNSFLRLSEIGVISQSFAKELAPSAGLRNRLVHEYEEIDDKIVFKSIKKAIENYSKYIKIIEKYLKNKVV